MRKVTRRIVPFVMLLYLVSFLDRVNVGFAALGMNRDLGIDARVFGLGAGIFFVGYAVCEVPSNLLLNRVGARVWIARVMLSWGVVSGAMAFVVGAKSFLVLRLLLGLAEAGFFPGVLLYLSRWFPRARIARATGVFMVAAPLAGIVGSPLSVLILRLHGVLGLAGWQWVFLLEAAPAVVLGVSCLFVLTDGPERARWLEPAERDWLSRRLAGERPPEHGSIWRAMGDGRVLILAATYLGTSVGLYVVGIWGPVLLRAAGASLNEVAVLNALPNLLAAALMVPWARRSDRTGERLWHVALPCLLAGAGLLLVAAVPGLPGLVAGLVLAAVGVNAAKPPLWSLPPQFLSGAGAAAGIALINSLGTLGGAVGPLILGFARAHDPSPNAGFGPVAAILFVSAALVPVLAWRLRRAPEPTSPVLPAADHSIQRFER
ncbi:MAG: MFS transporter [Gluconacetobacter diazotrophicus]|nr:MFS transporter [Gluconacetobacter diazotrophicus]